MAVLSSSELAGAPWSASESPVTRAEVLEPHAGPAAALGLRCRAASQLQPVQVRRSSSLDTDAKEWAGPG